MRLLVSGGFGYLGGRLAQFLATQKKHEISLGSRSRKASPSWLPQAMPMQMRWCSLSSLEETCSGVDAVVHLAGMNAQECAVNPALAKEFNGGATSCLLRAAVRQGVRRFIYVSTAHVYCSPLAGVITEETCTTNLHPYATSHRAGEDAVLQAHQQGELEGIVIRLSNSFGAPAHKDVNCWSLLTNDLCRQAATNRRMILRSSGAQRRDFITVTDACRAILHLLELSTHKLSNILFNVGGCWSPTILEMTNYVAERFRFMTGYRPEIVAVKNDSTSDDMPLEYNTTKLMTTGFKLGSKSNMDSEIDALIQYCLTG